MPSSTSRDARTSFSSSITHRRRYRCLQSLSQSFARSINVHRYSSQTLPLPSITQSIIRSLNQRALLLIADTTAAFKSLNDPLRGRGAYADKPHPFPVTIMYLTDGIKRLRAVSADEADGAIQYDLWRGMRNVELPQAFRERGGTELAPMSTSFDIKVAQPSASAEPKSEAAPSPIHLHPRMCEMRRQR